ncbi:MAG: phosphate ABC transporter permease subunit PstC [Nitrososphaerota archaeon]|nr:phosphate ABC transporter permease subunit PstC [Nitrososphaerota archaeon]MDG6990180.1 phosphate ABC transporter permease subunit PstC [Nitrososphaerota archaeon]
MKSENGARRKSDRVYGTASALLGSSALLFLFLILVVLAVFSYPSIVVNGSKFFSSVTWNPGISTELVNINGFPAMSGASYGMLVFVSGTLISSALALLIGAPLSIGVAVFLATLAPKRLSKSLSFFVELLAGIPSIVFGFWGMIVLGPLLVNVIEPALAQYLGFIPGFGGPVYGYGLLASGVILSLMIVPIIAAISRDAMTQTPVELKEAGMALGMTNWEVTRKIVLPYAKTAIIGSLVLGLGRALGETMAVVMVSQSALNILPGSIYYPINTLSAFMAVSFDSAFTDPSGMEVSALVELALVLFVITTAVNVVARLLMRHGFISSAEHLVQV